MFDLVQAFDRRIGQDVVGLDLDDVQWFQQIGDLGDHLNGIDQEDIRWLDNVFGQGRFEFFVGNLVRGGQVSFQVGVPRGNRLAAAAGSHGEQ